MSSTKLARSSFPASDPPAWSGNTLDREPPRIGEQVPVPDRVEDLLGTRVEQLSPPIRRLLLALALSGELRARQLAGLGDAGSLDAAVSEGLVVVDDDRPRASHPLLAAAALQRSTAGERRELHLELADLLATDGELRARHLALARRRGRTRSSLPRSRQPRRVRRIAARRRKPPISASTRSASRLLTLRSAPRA